MTEGNYGEVGTMDGIDFLIEFLNDYYKAKLKNIHDIAGNIHLSGYSELYKKTYLLRFLVIKICFTLNNM